MDKFSFKKERILLVSWILLPFLVVWISTNYLIGMNRQPSWQTDDNPKVAGAQTEAIKTSPPPEVKKINWSGQGLVTLWFDDAWVSQFTVAHPLLESKGLVGALAVPTGSMGYPDYMSWVQVKLLSYKGWEITSHTRSHSCDPERTTDEVLENELHGAQQDLNSHGIRADNFVTPCGADSEKTTEVAKKYYLSLRTSYPGVNPLPVNDPYNLKVRAIRKNTTADEVKKWLDEARDQKAWVILMFHQIDESGTDYSIKPEEFGRVIDTVKQSGLEVVLPIQALQIIFTGGENG
jgi:peptidoglycan/xylan/chitin deacetylase (PgdA/CDA1 family)